MNSNQLNYFERLPNEIQFEPLMSLPYRDLLNYCVTDRQARAICQDPIFWRRKYEHDFGQPPYRPYADDWRKMYEDRLKIESQFYSFFAGDHFKYVMIDNLGQLYRKFAFSEEPPRKMEFGEKVIHVSSNDRHKFGITTANGNGYILKYNQQIKVMAPDNKKIIKLELFSANKLTIRGDKSLFIPYLMILDDQSVYYNTDVNGLLEKLEFPDNILTTVIPNNIIYYNHPISSIGRLYTKIFISDMNSPNLYVFDVNVNGRGADRVLSLTYTETIQLPVIATQISYAEHRPEYMILSPDGEVYTQGENGNFEKLPIREKVKFISRDWLRYLVTETEKLYIWDDRPNPNLEMFLLSNTDQSIKELIPKYPVEMSLSDEVSQGKFGILYAELSIDRGHSPHYSPSISQGVAITRNGQILTWEHIFGYGNKKDARRQQEILNKYY